MEFRLNLPASCLLIGESKSGKSHLLKCIMGVHANFFNYGVVFSSTCFNREYSYINDEFVFEDYDDDLVKKIMIKQRNFIDRSHSDPNLKIPECFIIVDDNLGLMNLHKKGNTFDILFAKGRHFHISVFLCIQSPSYLSPSIRSNATYVFVTVLKPVVMEMIFNISRGFKNYAALQEYLDTNCIDHRVVMFDNSEAYNKFSKIIRAPAKIPNYYLDY